MVSWATNLARTARDASLAALFRAMHATSQKPALLVLMYHRVIPAADPQLKWIQPGMYVTPQTLDMHLRLLQELGFRIQHLDDAIQNYAAAGPTPRCAAITFDDGWRDNYLHALPVLKKNSAPASIFLVSDVIGTHGLFWPDVLTYCLCAPAPEGRRFLPAWLTQQLQSNGSVDAPLTLEQANHVIDACKHRSDEQMREISEAIVENGWGPALDRQVLDWPEIHEMARSGVIRFGSHTRTHKRLGGAEEPALLNEEIRGSRAVLEKELGRPVATFCYPNGDLSERAVQLVRQSYDAAVTTRPGIFRQGMDRHQIPRVGMHEDASRTRQGFLARISRAMLGS